jgi:hypothetical protein
MNSFGYASTKKTDRYLFTKPLDSNMRVIKTISLCKETADLAANIPNFSEWVRAKLFESDEKRRERDLMADKIWKETGKWPEWYQ